MKHLKTTLAAALTSLATLAASPVHAADGLQYTTSAAGESLPTEARCTSSDPGRACFVAYGEWFWVRDIARNGLPVGVFWSWSKAGAESREGVIVQDDGSDSGWGRVNKSFDEGGTVSFQLCDVTIVKRQIGTQILRGERCTSTVRVTT